MVARTQMRTFSRMSPGSVSGYRFRRNAFAEPRSFTIVRRVAITLACIHLVMAVWSGYRAIWQVLRLSVASPAVLRAGSTISFDVLSSGRVPVHVVLELVQGVR